MTRLLLLAATAPAVLVATPPAALCQPAATAVAEAPDLKAIDDLGQAVDDAPAAVSRLSEMLASEDAMVRWHAARALGKLGPAAADATAELAKLMSDADPVVVVHASIALAKIGDKSEATLEALIAKVTDKDERVARAAIQTLRYLGAPPEKIAGALEAVLESDDAAVMAHAVDHIVSRGAEATPFLNASLEKEKSAYWAAIAIGEIGPDAAGTVPGLVKLLGSSKDIQTRQLAMIALAKIGPASRPAAGVVEAIARTTEEDGQRIAACYALGAIGAESATGLLHELEASGGEFQAMACAWSLAKLHPEDPDALAHALELVVAGLKSEREPMRNAAAAGLRELDPPREQASAALIAAVRSATPEQRSYIALALASLGPEVVPRAVKALGDPDLRGVAIEVLGRLGEEAAGGVDGLVGVLKLDAAEAVAKAQYALAAIGEDAGKAAGSLAENLKSDAESVRHSALYALRQLGAGASEAAEPLHAFLESTDDQFEQLATAWALAKLKLSGAVLERVTRTLEAGLESDDERVRLETISAIRDLGEPGAVFEAKLQAMAASDPSPEVRAAAARD